MSPKSESWEEWVVQYEVKGPRYSQTGEVQWVEHETANVGKKFARENAKDKLQHPDIWRNVKLVRRQCTVMKP